MRKVLQYLYYNIITKRVLKNGWYQLIGVFYISVMVFILFFWFLVSRQMVWDEMVFGGVFWWVWAISGLHSWVYQKERWESNSSTHWEVSLCSTSI